MHQVSSRFFTLH